MITGSKGPKHQRVTNTRWRKERLSAAWSCSVTSVSDQQGGYQGGDIRGRRSDTPLASFFLLFFCSFFRGRFREGFGSDFGAILDIKIDGKWIKTCVDFSMDFGMVFGRVFCMILGGFFDEQSIKNQCKIRTCFWTFLVDFWMNVWWMPKAPTLDPLENFGVNRRLRHLRRIMKFIGRC